jgi:protocatechuate 3,4-dioxygenase beta subunit
MRLIDENTVTDAVLEQMAPTSDARLKEVMGALVRHLHAFAREVDLKPEEWLAGIAFLTAVGQKCTPHRQEFILLSDTLGLSTVVNALHDKRIAETGTKSSILGPYYRQNSPQHKLGESIAGKTHGQPIAIYGRVTNKMGEGIPNASIEIWQTDEEGNYDLQKTAAEEMDLRGTFHTDSDGRFYLRSVRPRAYQIPMDGPVGKLLQRQGRHGYRPAHIHFLVGAPGYREVVTAAYMGTDEYLQSDTVFGVMPSLVTETNPSDASSPFPDLPSLRFDFTLAAQAKGAGSGRVGADASKIGA